MYVKKYSIVLTGLMIVLSVLLLSKYNTDFFKSDIENRINQKVTSDLVPFVQEKNKDKINELVSNYLQSVSYEFSHNHILMIDEYIMITFGFIVFMIVIILVHYLFYLSTQKKILFFKASVIFSMIWLLVVFMENYPVFNTSRLKDIVLFGLIPIIVLIGIQWITYNKEEIK